MDASVKNIILTAIYQETGKPDYENLTTDVIVQFDDGGKYIATFISSKDLVTVVESMNDAHENVEDYKILNAVLVKNFNNGDLRPVIEAMLSEGDFQLVFKKM